MKIDILQTIVGLSTNKKNTILAYLPGEIKEQLQKTEYTNKEYFINDKIYCIRKDNLDLEIIGKIFEIEDTKLGIRISHVRNQFIDTTEYHTFVQAKQEIKTQRELMKQLWKQLQEK